MAIATVSAASSTSNNWLKEAQESLAASEQPGGMLGTLQDARSGYSLKTFLAKSQNAAYALAQITASNQTSANALLVQMSQTSAQKRHDELVALAAKLNPVQTNYTPPKGLDPVVFFDDGSTLDTTSNILTMSNGKQIDTTTGQEYHDPKDIISMANGAYLDTKNNILHMADGTQLDSITGVKITV